ncbi:hypothetical protein Cfor_09917 [Coptotermes formosanus]|uniref:Secreted protein n=1 Tax=Coptotermes formosanus TaxID=36987 RepID=A0A6L2PC14_COPFO|nr:hypothetical protein Cfor_09917 [Coptotermes formosanus]
MQTLVMLVHLFSSTSVTCWSACMTHISLGDTSWQGIQQTLRGYHCSLLCYTWRLCHSYMVSTVAGDRQLLNALRLRNHI